MIFKIFVRSICKISFFLVFFMLLASPLLVIPYTACLFALTFVYLLIGNPRKGSNTRP